MVQQLRNSIADGEYVVDAQAVAEAMLARRRIGFTSSAMLIATETGDGTAFRVPDDEASTGKDGA